jgi:hypothetical protein
MRTVIVGESSFFLQFPLKQLLIYNAYCVIEYRLLKFYLLSEILPTSDLHVHLRFGKTLRYEKKDITSGFYSFSSHLIAFFLFFNLIIEFIKMHLDAKLTMILMT